MLAVCFGAAAYGQVHISTSRTSLVLDASEGQKLMMLIMGTGSRRTTSGI